MSDTFEEADEMVKLKRIYSPDRETSRADVVRYKDYSEELETIEPFQPEYAVHYYFFRSWSKNDLKFFPELEGIIEEDTEEVIGVAEEIGKSTQTKHCSDWDDENLHPYIKMMASPMTLDVFKFKEEKVNVVASVKDEIQKNVQIEEENVQLTTHLLGNDKKTEKKDKKNRKTDGKSRHNFLRRLIGV
uniref:Uncharacterized protein LOC111125336 isoform X2 n=1 Tax=Crassostrea virginica TaxID=6565 RepID=A0A8B8DB17_CRAVI|nr:uncharacterized protein LOC111125336 isoform X2 [Crassostrea virginica]XP_022324743.1 uncharacterized protein LOC111125336 isoform X2 [Crassostrea virginica]XP_022324744.1 uncharacterized protein LOC111125336 isoform X2 [Crassostrea virginica]XP_022324745.1 uncharacterized protein LOC111125336 isoform X2 [Crassostrea virginica]XP_022324746.1 uncharacterized protein LOC111125336 isoform X2 [Crassostrea virginica]XP_022324748.1 uncharacterized protein LOC111125336 isoform X2 [Crassostrea virg